MEIIVNVLKNDYFLIGLVLMLFIIFVILLVTISKVLKLNKKYNEFIKKVGNGNNIEEDLKNYMFKVERVEKQNSELVRACDILNENLKYCVQKVGVVRYNAFKDTGSDLSFAVAFLDKKNDGIVLNGIYSREMSNIYAKPVENGKTTYKSCEEEEEAIRRAISKEK